MTERMAFLLFGDQSLSVHDTLVDFFHRGNNAILAKTFLEGASAALKTEVDGLSTIERHRIPTFGSIQELNEKYHVQDEKTSALDSALTCIAQLALYIE